MRRLAAAAIVLAVCLGLTGCALTAPSAKATLERSVRFEDVQRRYTNDVRFRQFDSAVAFVEPDLRQQFRDAADQLGTIRFTGVTVEQIDIDPLETTATVTVRWRGFWLDSPFEREIRTTQHWRRAFPSQDWYVTPELEALGANVAQLRRSPAASMPRE